MQLAGEGSVLVVTDHFEPDAWPPEVELAEILRAADASAGHVFGVRLSAQGNRLAVAALEVSALGAVYVFEHGPSG